MEVCQKIDGAEVAAPVLPDPKPWGFWMTSFFSVVVMGGMIFVQLIVFGALIAVELSRNPGIDFEEYIIENALNGFCLALCTVVSAVPTVGMIVLFAGIRKRISIDEYLGCVWPGRRVVVRWLALTGLFILVTDVATGLVGKPIVPEVMLDIHNTAVFPPLLFVALVVAAPIVEELLFRGFIFKGFMHSRIGTVGAIILTSIGWALLHVQYDMFGIGLIFLYGIYLGIARVKTKSVYTTIAIHAMMNVVASVEVVIVSYMNG